MVQRRQRAQFRIAGIELAHIADQAADLLAEAVVGPTDVTALLTGVARFTLLFYLRFLFSMSPP